MKKNLSIAIFILRLYQASIVFISVLLWYLFLFKNISYLSIFEIFDTFSIKSNEQTAMQILLLAISFGTGGLILLLALEQIVLILKNFQSAQLFEQINSKRFEKAGYLFFILSIIIALFPVLNGLINNKIVFAIRFDGALLTCLIGTILIILSSVFEKAKEIDTENKMTI